jgi:hypothetical protein
MLIGDVRALVDLSGIVNNCAGWPWRNAEELELHSRKHVVGGPGCQRAAIAA